MIIAFDFNHAGRFRRDIESVDVSALEGESLINVFALFFDFVSADRGFSYIVRGNLDLSSRPCGTPPRSWAW